MDEIPLFDGQVVDLAETRDSCWICGARVAPSLQGFHLAWHDPERGRVYEALQAAQQRDKNA